MSSQSLIERLLRPRSVAIVGASPTPSSFGASVLRNLENAGFSGDIHLINPKRTEINGRPCIASVDDLPEGVDCAVLAIPKAGVFEAVMACGRRGVGGVIVFSAGFAEAGPQGLAEQQRLAAIAAEYGMIIEGPNCLGMVNFIDGVPLTFVNIPARRFSGTRGIAIASQSGAMAAVVGVGFGDKELGMTFSVSTGNEAVSNVEDYVEYLLENEQTHVIVMIVEQFRRAGKMLKMAARSRELGKYIVLLHPGRSSAARASAETHTGAMAGDYAVMRTKVEHAGVIVVETLEELLDVSEMLVRQTSLPVGGTAVLTESGAFKALTLDFCDSLGLALPPLQEKTAIELRKELPEFIPPSNPLDVTAQSLIDPGLYQRTLPHLLADEGFGSVVFGIILTDQATSELKFPPILAAVREVKPSKPVVFAALDEGAKFPHHYVTELRELGVAFYPSPERAFRALARLTSYSAAQGRRDSDRSSAAQLARMPSGVIPEYRSKEILASAGIRTPQGELARTVAEAKAIALRLGYPVVLKAQSAELSHKSDIGGVALKLANDAAIEAAWFKMISDIDKARPGLELDGILVEEMGAWGVELIVGAQNDPDWGPVLLIGFGGVLAEALHDIRLIPPDLSVDAIMAEILKLKSAALLEGFRGSTPLDVRAAAEIVYRLGTIMLTCPEVREVDINPVIVYQRGHGAVALDALIVASG